MVAGLDHADVSRHKCLIYDGHPSEQLSVIVPLLIDGLAEGRRCLYLGDPEMVAMVEAALASRGVDVAHETTRGALVFSSDRAHLAGGFDPAAMVEMLVWLIDEAVRDGFQGLCATGDMRWELGTDENFERVLEYEALLEQVFRTKPLSGICQYHRATVPASALQDALLAHRSVYIGDVLHRDNLFYLPPELLLEGHDDREQHGEWMYRQITRILKAERRRDEALNALRESEAQQRRLATELAEANRDLERRVRDRTRELEAVNQELEAFSYSVSHDLKAPVRHIASFAQLLSEDSAAALGEQGFSHLDRIQAATRHMNQLIEAMLTLARVARQELRRGPVDLAALADAAAEGLRQLEPGRAVELVVQRDLRAHGDASLLRAVMENLLGNAWKFTAGRSPARVEVGRAADDDGRATFFVADNGAGFDMAQADRLFGVFQRLHTEQEFPGTGVGLATVRRIIQRHGGRIWAEASPDQGARFYFSLPVP
jgi:signal transduction histidine kinase